MLSRRLRYQKGQGQFRVCFFCPLHRHHRPRVVGSPPRSLLHIPLRQCLQEGNLHPLSAGTVKPAERRYCPIRDAADFASRRAAFLAIGLFFFSRRLDSAKAQRIELGINEVLSIPQIGCCRGAGLLWLRESRWPCKKEVNPHAREYFGS